MPALDFRLLKNISDWERLPDTSIVGTRDKIVLREPDTGKLCFIKFPKQKATEDIQQLEIITEYVATEIAKSFGIETHDFYPAIYQDRLGINTLMLVQDKTDFHLVYPKQLIHEDLRQIEKEMPEEKDYDAYRRLHTFDHVLELFEKYFEGYEGFFEEKFLPGFLRMIIFDASVGMMDRHWENYAVLKRVYMSINHTYEPALESFKKKPDLLEQVLKIFPYFKNKDKILLQLEVAEMNFAPIYDNSSCLFWNVSDDKLPETQEAMHRYANSKKAWSQICIPGQGKSTLFELLEYICSQIHLMEGGSRPLPLRPILIKEYEKIRQNYYSDKVGQVIENNHSGLYSEKRQNLIRRYVDFRMNLIDNVFRDN